MAVWLIIKKAIKIWFAIKRLKREKVNAYRIHRGLKPIYTWCQLIWFGIKWLLKCIFLNLFCFCCLIKCRGWKHSFWELLWMSGSWPNEIAKSFIGLIVGLLCTHLCTLFLIFSLNISPTVALSVTLVLGTIFTFSLAFTQAARCFSMLALPPLLFSKEGRVALLAYILVLALSGPGKNTAHNMEVLTESLVCSEEMANKATGGLIDLIKNPTSFLSRAVKIVVAQINEVKAKILASLGDLQHVISAVIEVVLEAYNWIKGVLDFCNDGTGSAYNRCWASFQAGVDDCIDKLPEGLQWACSIAEVGQTVLCPIAKVPQILLCWFPSFAKQELYLPIKYFLEDFMEGFKKFFKVGIHFHHHFHHSFNTSKSVKEIVRDIKEEVVSEVRWLLVYVDWVDMLVSLFFIYGFFKALIYRYRYLHSDRYDNWYITKGLVRLNWERKSRGRQFIFPLKYRESMQYVDNYSFRLLEHEARVLRYSLIIVFISCVKISSYLVLDLLLFAFLECLRKYGAIRIETQEQLTYSAKIIGTGFLADMYRGILRALTPVGESLPAFDTTPCLPIAREPDYWRYAIIILLMLLVILTTYGEPWGLRMRHIICSWYYPERTLPRERWLYFHILNSRSNFFSFAKSQLQARFTKDKFVYRVSFLERLSHTVPGFYYFVKWMGWEKKSCFICGRSGDKDDYENFYHCPSCHSVFCMECYHELDEECPLCSATMRTDSIDEETGSDSEGKKKLRPQPKQTRSVTQRNYVYKQLRSSSSSSSESPQRAKAKPITKGEYVKLQSDSETEAVTSATSEDENTETPSDTETTHIDKKISRTRTTVSASSSTLDETDIQSETETKSAQSGTPPASSRSQSSRLEAVSGTERISKKATLNVTLQSEPEPLTEQETVAVTSSPTPSPEEETPPSPVPRSRTRRNVISTYDIGQLNTKEEAPQEPEAGQSEAASTELAPSENVRVLKRKIVRISPKVESTSAAPPTPSKSTVSVNAPGRFFYPQDVPSTTSALVAATSVKSSDSEVEEVESGPPNPKSYYRLYYPKKESDDTDEEVEEEDDIESRICRHHQSVDDATYTKYYDVVSELDSRNPRTETDSSSTQHVSSSATDNEDDLESGICYHHQSVDDETMSKYSDVVSELESMQEGDEASSSHSSPTQESDTSTTEVEKSSASSAEEDYD